MLYVRTEKRPNSEAPEHFFVETHDRTVFHRWLSEGAPVPEEWELVLDPEATARADALEAELEELRAERRALVEAMKAAVSVVPGTVATHLRDVYREHRGEVLTRESA